MENSNFIEYCCYHIKAFENQYHLYKTDNFIPYYSGDDELNKYLNEFTMQLYLKNHINEIQSDFICISHYRRKFNHDNIPELNQNILVWREDFIYDNYINEYFEWLNKVCAIDIIKIYNEYALKTNPQFIYNGFIFNDIKHLYMRETYIMHKDIFVEMVTYIENFLKYLFDILSLPYTTEGFGLFIKHYIYNYRRFNYTNKWLWFDNINNDNDRTDYHRYLAFIVEFLICYYCTIQYRNNCIIN